VKGLYVGDRRPQGIVDVHVERYALNTGLDIPRLDMWFVEPLEVAAFIDTEFGQQWVAFYALYLGGLSSRRAINVECIIFKSDPNNFALKDVQNNDWSITADVGR
jgi:hypothetical protein